MKYTASSACAHW